MGNSVKPKLITIFLLIVLVPVALLGWLGLRVARDEQEIVEHKFRTLLHGKRGDVDATVAALMADRERELLRLTGNGAADAASPSNRACWPCPRPSPAAAPVCRS